MRLDPHVWPQALSRYSEPARAANIGTLYHLERDLEETQAEHVARLRLVLGELSLELAEARDSEEGARIATGKAEGSGDAWRLWSLRVARSQATEWVEGVMRAGVIVEGALRLEKEEKTK